jgi:hypothetical protein
MLGWLRPFWNVVSQLSITISYLFDLVAHHIILKESCLSSSSALVAERNFTPSTYEILLGINILINSISYCINVKVGINSHII